MRTSRYAAQEPLKSNHRALCHSSAQFGWRHQMMHSVLATGQLLHFIATRREGSCRCRRRAPIQGHSGSDPERKPFRRFCLSTGRTQRAPTVPSQGIHLDPSFCPGHGGGPNLSDDVRRTPYGADDRPNPRKGSSGPIRMRRGDPQAHGRQVERATTWPFR
jgi:hypothetical protein